MTHGIEIRDSSNRLVIAADDTARMVYTVIRVTNSGSTTFPELAGATISFSYFTQIVAGITSGTLANAGLSIISNNNGGYPNLIWTLANPGLIVGFVYVYLTAASAAVGFGVFFRNSRNAPLLIGSRPTYVFADVLQLTSSHQLRINYPEPELMKLVDPGGSYSSYYGWWQTSSTVEMLPSFYDSRYPMPVTRYPNSTECGYNYEVMVLLNVPEDRPPIVLIETPPIDHSVRLVKLEYKWGAWYACLSVLTNTNYAYKYTYWTLSLWKTGSGLNPYTTPTWLPKLYVFAPQDVLETAGTLDYPVNKAKDVYGINICGPNNELYYNSAYVPLLLVRDAESVDIAPVATTSERRYVTTVPTGNTAGNYPSTEISYTILAHDWLSTYNPAWAHHSRWIWNMSEVTWLVDNGQVKIAKDEIYEPHKVAVDNTSSFGHTYWNEMFTNYSGYVSRVGVSVYEFPVPAATKSVNLIFINTDIYTKDRGIHSGLTYIPPIKYLYVPKIGNRQLLISPSVLSAEHALQPIYQSDNGWSYRPSYKMWPGRPMVVNPRPVQVYESFFVISPLAANVDIRDVTIGPNSEFLIAIASAFTHSILKSTTGTTWTATTYSIPSELTVVTCFKKHPTGYIISGTLADNVNNLDANGVPIPIGDHVYESTDLINWTDMTQAVKTVGSLVTGAFSVLLTETNGLVYMKTTDYITYVSTYFVNYNYTWCVCTSLNTMVAELANLTTPDYLAADPISIGSVYVTLSIYGRVAISYDGITNWHVIDIIPLGDSTILMLSKIESEGRILALCSNGSILYSSNGYLWRNVTTNLSSCISFVNESVYLLVKLAYSYILTATSQIVLMSADLQTWTSASNFQDVSLRSCHTINSNTVMAGYSKTGIGYYNTL